jgi:hypothetical protein
MQCVVESQQLFIMRGSFSANTVSPTNLISVSNFIKTFWGFIFTMALISSVFGCTKIALLMSPCPSGEGGNT